MLQEIVHAIDVTLESRPLDPHDPSIEICDWEREIQQNLLSVNFQNCPTANTGQDLLCRLFSIIPLANNPNDLATSTALLDPTIFDIFGSEAGNDNGIITVLDNGCKPDQCRHADGSTSALRFAYNYEGANDDLQIPFAITATCDCDEYKGETAHLYPTDPADPFECMCDGDQEKFQVFSREIEINKK